jgi:hypothetical protein
MDRNPGIDIDDDVAAWLRRALPGDGQRHEATGALPGMGADVSGRRQGG